MSPNSANAHPERRPEELSGLLPLFEELPDVVFSVKGADGRYTSVNRAFVARTGKRSRREVLGRTATELFVPDLARRYEEQDAEVLRSARPLRHELEVIRFPGGAPGWYVTTKVPWPSEAPRAVIAISTDLRAASNQDSTMEGLRRVVSIIDATLASDPSAPIRAVDLAAQAGCSPATLERRMARVFGLTVRQFVLKTRTDLAMRLLASSQLSIAQIAARCGFYDQASFTRRFASLTGETPAQFRAKASQMAGQVAG